MHINIIDILMLILSAISTVVTGILIFVLKGLLTDIRTQRRAQKEGAEQETQAMRNGILALLRVRLIEYHEIYVAKGNIPNYAYENWLNMYKAYEGLGGNGMVVHMNEDIEELKFGK